MTQYVLLKRDLYECPGHKGYTGIRDKAGRWSEEEIKASRYSIANVYNPSYREHYAIPLDIAPEFTNDCFHDLSLAHLRGKVERLQEALTPFAKAGEIKLCSEWRDDERFAQTDVGFYLNFGHLRRAAQVLKEAS